jgi:hypothetical protein
MHGASGEAVDSSIHHSPYPPAHRVLLFATGLRRDEASLRPDQPQAARHIDTRAAIEIQSSHHICARQRAEILMFANAVQLLSSTGHRGPVLQRSHYSHTDRRTRSTPGYTAASPTYQAPRLKAQSEGPHPITHAARAVRRRCQVRALPGWFRTVSAHDNNTVCCLVHATAQCHGCPCL